MEGKLIKVDDVYRLIVDRLISGTTDSEYQKAFSDYCFMLSSNNCETIANGYDLDELAYEKSWNEDSEKGFINGAKAILEILGDKKFSEDELNKAYYRNENMFKSKPFEFFIESLQQTEWDVEVVTEDEFVSNQGLDYNESVKCRVLRIDGDDVYGEYIDGTLTNLDIPFSLSGLNDVEGNSVGKPKLDEDGCIILKRI
jgi:hypothetical protein